MSTRHDMPHDPAPLTAEEHALAQRLARLGAHAEPSPALDARILAAAHAAVASRPARSPRHRMRLPLAFGVAASLALAVGVAWRLRPLPEAAVQYESEAASTAAGMSSQDPETPLEAATPAMEPESAPVDTADPAANAATRVVDSASDAGSRIEATGAGIAAQAASQTRREQTGRVTDQAAPDAFPPAAAEAPPAEPSQVAAPREAPIVFEQPPPAAPPPPPASAAPAKPVPASPMADGVATDARMQRARQSQEQSESKAMAAESEIEMDIPPATADAPEVRDAWLQRIRELADAGQQDDARASLREFTRRYPDYPLPDDLRALLP